VISRPDDRRRPVEHYENFPVASWLCPPRLRRPVAALYWFARTADDIADEGNATEGNRLAELDAYQKDLSACLSGNTGSGRWERVFAALGTARVEFALPEQPLFDLLAAFRQDVEKTRDRAGYRDREELLDYCGRSANPVGRLMLHLYEVTGAKAIAQSDAICTALQLANFWQDLSVDVPRRRYYLPATDAVRHGMDPAAPQTWATHAGMPALVRELCEWTEALMHSGAPLVHAVPGRAGWELRLVVQGGLRILRRIESLGYRTAQRRPTLRAVDVGPMLWHGMRM
jgi:hydroxysqualene synthase